MDHPVTVDVSVVRESRDLPSEEMRIGGHWILQV